MPAPLGVAASFDPGVAFRFVTGGLRARAEDVVPWLEAGALAVGLGGDIGTAGVDGAEEVERRARAALAAAAGRSG